MTDHELELEIRRWFRDATDGRETAPAALRAALPAVVLTRRPNGPVRIWRSPGLLAAALLALALAGSMLAVGSGLVRLPAIAPTPSGLSTPDPSTAGDLIAYVRPTTFRPATCPSAGTCSDERGASQPWTVRADGREPHALFPDRPDARIEGVTWSPDGARLLFSEAGSLFTVDASGEHVTALDTACDLPCMGDAFGSISADGTRVSFIRRLGASDESIVAWMDLRTGHVVELAATLGPAIGRPRWSPDGRHIAYAQTGKFNEDNVVYIVDDDGGNLRRLGPASLPARSPDWSPDGTLIVFSSFEDRTLSVPGDNARAALVRDIYTIAPDGTGLHQLTTDGWSRGATWTPDGRILFARVPLDAANSPTSDASAGFWTMAADGGELRQIPDSSTAITPDTYFDDAVAFWQPTP